MKILNYFLLTFAIIFALSSCQKKITPEIQNILPQPIMDTLTNLGMPINRGTNPPTVEGTYHVSPFVLKGSNIPYDQTGHQFADLDITFTDFTQNDLSLKISYDNGPEHGEGIGAYIMGSGDKFTIVTQMKIYYNTDQDSALVDFIYSGTLKNDGIKDFYYANFMIDNFGNEQGVWIENGQGRVIYDQDGFSEKTSSKSSQSGSILAGACQLR